jgi:hypothetical protein
MLPFRGPRKPSDLWALPCSRLLRNGLSLQFEGGGDRQMERPELAAPPWPVANRPLGDPGWLRFAPLRIEG